MTLARRSLLAAPALLAGTGAGWGQTSRFPGRAVRIIVPYTAGGVSDITARLLAENLTPLWGQPVTVENRAGANGMIGAEVAARATPDGTTLCLAGTAHSISPALYRTPYDTMRDLAYITTTSQTPQALIVAPNFPPNTAQEFVDYVKARPNQTSYATFGALGMELFCQKAGLEMTRVPYRGSTQGHPDLIAGRVDAMLDTITPTLPHVREGRMKLLATCGATRAPQTPQVPTVAETVIPGFTSTVWGMLMGPAGMPPETVAKIHADVTALLHRPDILERHAGLGTAIWTMSPEEAQQFMGAEVVKWTATARAMGIEQGAIGR
ncbi:tripartite-type tricarboxylate transporter receptor subunit TctC [Humitalea rosea]|uniref:Tripartite-type tricarboxylate transporter receptor subunit TctC n=1 Tax=Humitalea rosea TaxID=990373 RepID=A0A2W7HUE7_9PROT|nr:tripartite tricarboxylate transporter substrate-binding protein [Humitalea rosea]PZW37732.1 tripartite-type tricarboxylate transporter receptor subunit TctC [Humitalea rosea]